VNLEEAIREIEGLTVSARLNLASGLGCFLEFAQQEPAVGYLLALLDSPDVQGTLFGRVQDLVQRPTDGQHENPWDVALALYSLLFRWKAPALARLVATLVARAEHCWWASRIAAAMLTARDRRTAGTRAVRASFGEPPTTPRVRARSAPAQQAAVATPVVGALYLLSKGARVRRSAVPQRTHQADLSNEQAPAVRVKRHGSPLQKVA
jgi:hypothetical protein